MAAEYDWLLTSHGAGGDAQSLFQLGSKLETDGEFHLAATAYDRAFGLQPDSQRIIKARQALLDKLAVIECGVTFRYIPAGSFLMGSDSGDPDEQPVHPVELSLYWLSETPISWATFCDLMDWEPPPYGRPKGSGGHFQGEVEGTWSLLEENKIRLQYSEDATSHAGDWHAHVAPVSDERPSFLIASAFAKCLDEGMVSPELRSELESRSGISLQEQIVVSKQGSGWDITATAGLSFFIVREHEGLQVYQGGIPRKYLFGIAPREDPRRPWKYDRKPMVSVSWQDAKYLCDRICNKGSVFRLPTEAEWEKAARGGRLRCKFPWGDALPSIDSCDFDRFDNFSILPTKRFPPNGYGLYAMSGGVWEWTDDWYDAQYYAHSPAKNPVGPANGEDKVLRGGSWADCSDVLTVSFRMARGSQSWREEGHGSYHMTPNIGFRICRVESVGGD